MQVQYFGPRGPYNTEIEVTGATGQHDWEPGSYRDRNLLRLTSPATADGVELGSYDQGVLAWLADAEPQTVEVIAAIIDRAADTAVAQTDPK